MNKEFLHNHEEKEIEWSLRPDHKIVDAVDRDIAIKEHNKIKKALTMLRTVLDELPDDKNDNIVGSFCNRCYEERNGCTCFEDSSPNKCYVLHKFVIDQTKKILEEA